MDLKLHRFELPLRRPFTISRGTVTVQETLIVELCEGDVCGYGEATTNDYYGASFEEMAAALENIRAPLASLTMTEPEELWAALNEHLGPSPFAQCALDLAAYDLWGKLRGAPVYQLWGLDPSQTPLTNYTLGIDPIDVMLEKMQEFPQWPVYKIKLGGGQNDLEIVRQLRDHTDAVFRVDANCGWSAEETIRNARILKTLNVEFIEQPLPADDAQGMQRVFAESVLPVVADESCVVEQDVARCRNAFHGVNIKLVKCGGLTPARRMVEEARKYDMKVMVGCMTESTVGISAIAQIAPLLDYVDMDGALLLADDIASGVSIERGVCRYPDENGCGVQLLKRAEVS